MSGVSLLFTGLILVTFFAVIFFGIISKRSEQDIAKVDRLIELNELTERKKMEKFMNDNDFYQVFQPFIDSKTEKIVGCEALTRLNGEDESDTMPDSFLKKIKKENLFDKFDMFVFKKCCEWVKNSETDMVITCNFSRRTLAEDGMAEEIIKTADSVGVKHSTVAVEITEDAVKDCDDGIRRNISELKEEGFKIYLDDFGKAYTSISDLSAFRPDVIKLDRGMLDDIQTDEGRQTLESVIKLIKECGAKALCEGIESKEQADIVKELGCDLMQGYYFYKPMRAEKPTDLI